MVNADVANSCFWMSGPMAIAALELVSPVQEPHVVAALRNEHPLTKKMSETQIYKTLKRLIKTRFTVSYRGAPLRKSRKYEPLGA